MSGSTQDQFKLIRLITALGWALAISVILYLVINGNLNQASYDQRLKKDPNISELYFMRGCNHQSFINTYQNPFKSDDQHHQDWKRENRLAEADFTKAIELSPDNACAYYHRARCKWWYHPGNLSRGDEAIADYKKALELVPFDGNVHFELARVYSAMGRSEEAIAEYQKALDYDCDRGNLLTEREMKQEKNKAGRSGS